MHYMYFAMLLFWLTGLVAAAVSLATPPPEDWRTVRTTFFTRFSERPRQDESEPLPPADEDKHTMHMEEEQLAGASNIGMSSVWFSVESSGFYPQIRNSVFIVIVSVCLLLIRCY